MQSELLIAWFREKRERGQLPAGPFTLRVGVSVAEPAEKFYRSLDADIAAGPTAVIGGIVRPRQRWVGLLDDLAALRRYVDGLEAAESERTPARGKFERWLAFHRANPAVYEMFERLSLEAWSNGHRRYGARAIWERIRWELPVEVTSRPDSFSLNDHYVPFYARLTMLRNPRVGDLFECRGVEVTDAELRRRAGELQPV